MLVRYLFFLYKSWLLGVNAVVLKNGSRLCGSGGALANSQIIQNKAYFEITIQQAGKWGVGLGTKFSDLSTAPTNHSFLLQSDGSLIADGKVLDARAEFPVNAGKTIVNLSLDK